MKRNRPQDKSKKPLVADCSASEEQKELEAFCTSVPVEEISFEHWCQHHDKLDLQYPITIARAQLSEAFKKVIRLSRSIKITSSNGRIETREKIEHEIVLLPQDEIPKVIVVPGLGDRLDELVGDLRIIIHVKD